MIARAVLPAGLGPYRRRDYEQLPVEDQLRSELILGRLYRQPSAGVLHQLVVPVVWQLLKRVARAAGGDAEMGALDVAIADHSIVKPDGFYVAPGRSKVLEGAPDLVAEVLIPGHELRDRREKLALYAETGVREYWLIDPARRVVEVLVNDRGRFVVTVPRGRVYRSAAVAGVYLDLVAIWRRVERRLPPAWREAGGSRGSPAGPGCHAATRS